MYNNGRGSFAKLVIGCTVGIILLLVGLYFFLDTQTFLGRASRTSGTVVQVNRSGGSKATYYPVIGFETAQGEKVQQQLSIGSNPPQFQTGQKVTVFYDPVNPRNFKLDEFISLWLLATIAGGIGLLFLLFSSLGYFFGSWRSRSRNYSSDPYWDNYNERNSYYYNSDNSGSTTIDLGSMVGGGSGSSDWGSSDSGGSGSSDWGSSDSGGSSSD